MIRFYKKSISLMLAVLLCLPLAACSREEKTGELNPPPSATQEDTITPELSVTLPGAPSQTAVPTCRPRLPPPLVEIAQSPHRRSPFGASVSPARQRKTLEPIRGFLHSLASPLR